MVTINTLTETGETVYQCDLKIQKALSTLNCLAAVKEGSVRHDDLMYAVQLAHDVLSDNYTLIMETACENSR